MHYSFDTFTRYSIPLFCLAMFISLLGCEARNPVCSDNFCVVGEVFARSELQENQEFSEVDVDDSVIFATLLGTTTPVERIPVETEPTADDVVPLADIVADVASGGTRYSGKIITITAEVQADVSTFTDRDAITLITNNENVWFFVHSSETPARLANYEVGKTYTFNLFVLQVIPPEVLSPEYKIWTNIPIERVSAGMNAIVSDVIAGGKTYIDKVVEIQAKVRFDTTIFTPYDTITLETNNDKVSFFISNTTETITILDRYKEGSTYEFTVFIRDIRLNSSRDGYNIFSHIVVE